MSADQRDAKVFRFDQSGALLRKVMESAAVGMTLVGVDGRMIYANPAYEAMLGYAADECLGKPSAGMIFAEDQAVIELHFGRLMAGEVDEFRLETRMRHSDGSPLWVLASASLLRSDATGRPLYAIVQVINIDRQKRAEEALAASESRWNFALEAAGQGVWDHDIPRDGMFYSRMWRKMRGIPDDEPIDPAQDAWLARVHPDDVPKILSTVDKQDAGEDGYDTLEYRERHRDGHYMWILSRGRPVEWDSNGKALRTVGTDTDITKLKTTEAQLADEKERFRVTLESIGDGVISTDAEEHVIYMNPVAEAMTGWAEAEAFGRPLADVFDARSEQTDAPACSAVSRCLSTGEATQMDADVVLHGRNGAARAIRGTAASLKHDTGGVLGTVLVFQDITESRELHRQLAYSASHDPLTELPNRTAFEAAMENARRQVLTEQRRHVLCFIDLDRFKAVNDSAGHAAGDALLRDVARIIRDCGRSHDFTARIGGDEFVMLLADCSLESAKTVASKIIRAVAHMKFRWDGRPFEVGCSIGIAPIRADAAHDALADADAACYVAKGGGRNRVVVSGV